LIRQYKNFNTMKVTALINDDLVNNVIKLSKGKNITDSLSIALEYYVYRKKIEQLIEDIDKDPLQFQEGFSADGIRKLNRRKRS
jgi:hypothetical protein